MENTEQQIFDTINKSQRILIALPQNPNGDAVGTGLALFGFLKKLEKEPEIVSAAGNLKNFSFLPASTEIKSGLQPSQSFVISVATASAELDELSYEAKEDRVEIYLKPKAGKFREQDVSFGSAKFPYDLVLTVSAPALENLGSIYEQNTDLFFETPVVNIDHHPTNEYYGEINHVDLAATSTAEIVATMIENFEGSLIDEQIATNLLAGIIVETNSFQHVKTTPRAFLRASRLIAQGGDHQNIIRELYKTKSISLLKLWGRALARIREMPDLGLTYSLVNHTDIEKTGSREEEMLGVMRELVANLADRKIVVFLAETTPQNITGYYHLHPTIKSQVVSAALGGQMLNGALGIFQLKDKPLLEVETEVLQKLGKIKDQITV